MTLLLQKKRKEGKEREEGQRGEGEREREGERESQERGVGVVQFCCIVHYKSVF